MVVISSSLFHSNRKIVIMANIGIVEDEFVIASDLSEYIKGFGYNVSFITDNGQDAIIQAKLLNPDLILMDISIHGDLSGIDAAIAIHENANTPIIFVTAYYDEDTIKKAEKAKPFGFITKPFQESTLKTTIHFALQKNRDLSNVSEENKAETGEANQVILGDSYVFDVDNIMLCKGEEPVILSKKALSLLTLLVTNKNRIVSYDSIEENVWKNDFMNQGSLRNLILKLRKEVPVLDIQSVSSHGYILRVH